MNPKKKKEQKMQRKFFKFQKKAVKTEVRDLEYIGDELLDKKQVKKICGLPVFISKPGSYQIYDVLNNLDIPTGEYVLEFNMTQNGEYYGVAVFQKNNNKIAAVATA